MPELIEPPDAPVAAALPSVIADVSAADKIASTTTTAPSAVGLPIPSVVPESAAAVSLSPEVLASVPEITAKLGSSEAFWDRPHDAAVNEAQMAWPDLGASDIMSLAYLILMLAAKSADADLEQIMADTKAEIAAKQRLSQDLAVARAEIDTADPSTIGL